MALLVKRWDYIRTIHMTHMCQPIRQKLRWGHRVVVVLPMPTSVLWYNSTWSFDRTQQFLVEYCTPLLFTARASLPVPTGRLTFLYCSTRYGRLDLSHQLDHSFSTTATARLPTLRAVCVQKAPVELITTGTNKIERERHSAAKDCWSTPIDCYFSQYKFQKYGWSETKQEGCNQRSKRRHYQGYS